MAKVPLPYSAGNKLADYIVMERGKRVVNSEKNVLLSEIETELANYCSLTRDGIKAIKNQKSSTSLPVALKIAQYFNADVTDIFPLVEDSEKEKQEETNVPAVEQRAKRRLGLRKKSATCDEPNCNGIHYAKGKCRPHYHEYYVNDTKS